MSQFHKKILAVLCSLLIGLCSISTAFAETSLPDGAVKGLPERLAALDDEGNPVNSETGEYFFRVENMQFGETYTKNVQLINLREDASFHIYFYVEPLSKSGEHVRDDIYRIEVPSDMSYVVFNNSGESTDALTVPAAGIYKYGTGWEAFDETGLGTAPAGNYYIYWQLIDSDNKGYTEFDSENKDYVYVYAYAEGNTPTIMERNDITNPLFDKLLLWNFNEKFDKNKPHDVKVEALGIQTDIPANDIYGVWDILSGEVSG